MTIGALDVMSVHLVLLAAIVPTLPLQDVQGRKEDPVDDDTG